MIFEHKDILILGDSFCDHRNSDTDWPFIVSQSLTGSTEKTRGYGFSGTSWWSVRKRLLKELKISVPKVLILCHTEPNRIPNDRDAGINWSILVSNRVSAEKELDKDTQHRIVKATKLYYEELCSSDYSKWAQLAWFKELDELIEVHKIPQVIHLICFNNSPEYVFQNSITIKEKLWTLAGFDSSTYDNLGLSNHFTEEMNKKVGNRLVELVLNYQPGLQELAL
jgi:hypothetical protein